MTRLANIVRDHLEKARSSVLAAVENYNRPSATFRTRMYALLMVVGWTALFHAVFYRNGRKPWHVKSGKGTGTRYYYVEGDPKHWELAECLREYYQSRKPPERMNSEFLLKLRNKIEHRNHPELDPALYGECQAALMNFENLLIKEFGTKFALAGEIDVALQFSAVRPEQQRAAVQRMQASSGKDVLEFIRAYRAGLPTDVLGSSSYALRVFLIPKLANRQSAADLSVEFVQYDPSKQADMSKLEQVVALIKDKRVPVASQGLLKPKEVVERLKQCLPFKVTMHTHTQAWRHYGVRPRANDERPEKTDARYCVFDALAGAYGYTEAWVEFLCRELREADKYNAVMGAPS